MHHVGTPHHLDDLHHELIRERGFKDITFDGETNEVFQGGELIETVELWPAKKKHIEDKRPPKTPMIHWMRNVKCQPVSSALDLFNEKIMNQCAHLSPELYGIGNHGEGAKTWTSICGIDLAGSKKTKKSAETCYGGLLLTPDNKLRVSEIISGTFNTRQKAEHVVRIFRTLPRTTFPVESNATMDYFQDILQDYRFMQTVAPDGIPCSREEAFAISNRVCTWETGMNKHDLNAGVMSMDSLFRGGRIEMANNEATLRWRFHLRSYSPDKHPKDDVMALWIAFAWLQDNAPMRFGPDMLIGNKCEMAGLIERARPSVLNPLSGSELQRRLSL
jgi:hypothetical protein